MLEKRQKRYLLFYFLIAGCVILFCKTGLCQQEEVKAAETDDTAPTQELSSEDLEKIRQVFELGLVYYRKGEYEEALSAFQIVLNLDPSNKKIEKFISLTQEKIGDKLLTEEKAKQESVKKVIQKRVYDLYAAGLYSLQYKKFDKAVEYFQEALKLDPHHQGAWNNLINARTELEKESKLVLVQSVEPKAQVAGKTSLKGEAEKLAEKETRKKLSLQEQKERQMEQVYSYAEKLLRCARYEEAEKEFHKIEDIEPKYRNTVFYLADIYKIKEAAKREQEPVRYTLGSEDVLEINVLGHPELSSVVEVEPGGEIILPLLKEVVMASGLTKEELAVKIKELLSKYVKEPEVQVVIKGYNSKKWYILGEVVSRGEYPLGKVNLTLMEALYQAGLPVEGVAAMRRVMLIKPHKTNPRYKSINVFDILYYGKMQDNVRIEPGDIIYVPKTVLAKVTGLITQISTPITQTKTGLEDLKSSSTAARALTPLKETFGPTPKSKK